MSQPNLVLDGRGLVIPARPDAKHLTAPFVAYLQGCLEAYRSLDAALEPGLRPAWERSVAALTGATRSDPRGVLHAFASPAIGTPLQCVYLRDSVPELAERIDAATRSLVPTLLLELVVRGLLPAGFSVEVPAGPGSLTSMPLGASVKVPAGTRGLRFEPGRVRASGDGVDAVLTVTPARTCEAVGGFVLERAYLPVGGVTRFALVDQNPIARFEAHPDKAGNQYDLGGREASEWTASLDDALGVVRDYCPELFAEMRVMLQQIVPVGYDEQRHLSASYREAIGTIYLTLHPQLMTMAEAIVHEFQHNKINLAAYHEGFLVNAFSPLYKSPVRPDPRPLWGILLAVHAFLPVAAMYRRMRERNHPRANAPDFQRRCLEIDRKNHEGMNMLRAHGEFTPAGRALMSELEAIENRHLTEQAQAGHSLTTSDVHLS